MYIRQNHFANKTYKNQNKIFKRKNTRTKNKLSNIIHNQQSTLTKKTSLSNDIIRMTTLTKV